jgi:hypothetical protein
MHDSEWVKGLGLSNVSIEIPTDFVLVIWVNWLQAGRLKGRILSPGRDKIVSSSSLLDRFWSPHSLLANEYSG